MSRESRYYEVKVRGRHLPEDVAEVYAMGPYEAVKQEWGKPTWVSGSAAEWPHWMTYKVFSSNPGRSKSIFIQVRELRLEDEDKLPAGSKHRHLADPKEDANDYDNDCALRVADIGDLIVKCQIPNDEEEDAD